MKMLNALNDMASRFISEYKLGHLTYMEAQSQLLGAFRVLIHIAASTTEQELLRDVYEDKQAKIVNLKREMEK